MLVVLWFHLPTLWAVGLASGHEPLETALDVGLLGLGASTASTPAFERWIRFLAATVTLLASSAVLVHVTGGLVEARFHFLLTVVFLTLYRERLVFLVALTYLALRHGLFGVLYPMASSEGPVDWRQPLWLAALHGGFVVLTGLTTVVVWRQADQERLADRQAAEAERRDAESERDRLATIVEISSDLVVVGRPDGRMAWMNEAGRTLLGLTAPGSHRIEDMFSAQEMARVYAEVMPVLSAAGSWRGTWVLEGRDGVQIPTAVAANIHLSPGEDDYVSCIMHDLRPQLEQERLRREGDRQLAAAELVAGMGSWEWDLVTDQVRWSPGMYRLHGMAEGDGEETVEAWAHTIHPDDLQHGLAAAEEGRSRGTVDFTYRAVRADGLVVVISCHGAMIENADGTGLSMLGTLLDITDRHTAAEALRESEERARRVIATAGDAYVQLDPDGLVAEWNDQAERSFGWPRAEVLGRPLSSVPLSPEGEEPFAAQLRLGTGTDRHSAARERFERTLQHRSDREFPAEVTAWTIRTIHGQVVSCFVRDISERLAAERAKDEFVSVVGHELRTPLTSIHGVLGLLRAGPLGELNERGQRMVDIAVQSTDRLGRLINDILDVERLSSPGIMLHREVCDVAVLAAHTIEVMGPMADEVGVHLQLEAGDDIVVWADPDRLEQTLTNLLSNAIKFSFPGGTVRLEVSRTAEVVSVRVRDEGRGIPIEHLESIFGRFQQVDGSDSREKGGSGLGLTICRTIVEQHGGRIWAESPPGGGATLTVTLPVDRLHEAYDAPQSDRRLDDPEEVARLSSGVAGRPGPR